MFDTMAGSAAEGNAGNFRAHPSCWMQPSKRLLAKGNTECGRTFLTRQPLFIVLYMYTTDALAALETARKLLLLLLYTTYRV